MKKHAADCCHTEDNHADGHAHGHSHSRFDFILWGSLALIIPAYAIHLLAPEQVDALPYINQFTHATYEMLNKMWWGVATGIFFVGLLSQVPKEIVISILGQDRGIKGILRATLAGVFLDLCSHGILLVGMKLYERGASLGQLMAFLIASPWNSLSLTLILWSLIGLKWTLLILVLSVVISIVSGMIFEVLTRRGILPDNPNRIDLPKNFKVSQALKEMFASISLKPTSIARVARDGIMESKMILKWLFLGVVLAGVFQSVFDADTFKSLYGPTLAGLGLTLLTATLIEVCSEGSTPIAADIFTRAHAPGNAFAFLMTGVSTDYTEIMALRETTKSWKIALFLPLITLPQVVGINLLINFFTQ